MGNILMSYRKHYLRNDTILSVILAVFLWLTAPLLIPFLNPDLDISQVISVLVAVMAEFASMFIAALAIVAGFVDTKYFDEIRNLTWFPDIWRFLGVTACVFLAGIGLGLGTLIFGFESGIAFGLLVVTIFLFVEVYRCVRLLHLLISHINNQRRTRST